jgi:hypothetical protein
MDMNASGSVQSAERRELKEITIPAAQKDQSKNQAARRRQTTNRGHIRQRKKDTGKNRY